MVVVVVVLRPSVLPLVRRIAHTSIPTVVVSLMIHDIMCVYVYVHVHVYVHGCLDIWIF